MFVRMLFFLFPSRCVLFLVFVWTDCTTTTFLHDSVNGFTDVWGKKKNWRLEIMITTRFDDFLGLEIFLLPF